MRWGMKGAHALLSLRSIHLSGLWDDFIAFPIQHESLRLYPQVEATHDVLPFRIWLHDDLIKRVRQVALGGNWTDRVCNSLTVIPFTVTPLPTKLKLLKRRYA